MPCSTFPLDPTLGPFTEIGIAPPLSMQKAGAPPPPIHWIKAIADTGCSNTSIFTGAAARIGLPIVSKTLVNSTTHTVAANVYIGDLFLKCAMGPTVLEFPFRDRQFIELLHQSPNFEALLGMDVMGLGHLTVNGHTKTATFCF